MARFALRVLFLSAVVILIPTLNAQKRSIQEEKIGDGVMVTVLPQDAIPAITKPAFVSRAEADPLMRGDEPVLGLVDPVTGLAKAYSLWHLDHHEIVNDQLGGKPIAVTW
jgi:hypothetical protein